MHRSSTAALAAPQHRLYDRDPHAIQPGADTMKPRTLATVLAAILALVSLPPAAPASAQDAGRFDVLIQGGRILDGTGNPWFRADIGVRDGRIVAVGRLEGARADRVVDAAGLYVSPGFIDIHSHADDGNARIGGATIRTNEIERKAAPNVVSQGVTTVVVNHDGRSPWPIRDQRSLLEAQGVGLNVMMMVGHGTVRREVMGDDFQRPATPEEVAEMQSLVRRSMAEGAVGMSAGLEYAPGRHHGDDRDRSTNRRSCRRFTHQGEGRPLLGLERIRDSAHSAGARRGRKGVRGSIPLRDERLGREHGADSRLGAR